MENYSGKKVMTVMLNWDYGIKERGISGEFSWFYKNFEEMDVQVQPFWFDEYLKDGTHLESDLLKAVENFQPELIFFVPYTDQFSVEFLKKLKTKCTTAAWFGDDHWRFDNFSSKYANAYTYCLTTDPWSLHKYKELGAQTILTEWAAQLGEPINIDEEIEYKHEISFIGGYNEIRGWYIRELKKLGIEVECFGANWPNGRVTEKQMNDIFRTSKINLNLSNSVNYDIRSIFSSPKSFARWVKSKKRSEQVKARNFEIPLAGGFQLSQYALGLERHFVIGSQIAVFTSPEECAKQIIYYQLHEQERLNMLRTSYVHVLENHTYRKRLEEILKVIF
ncbi:hypothetical protein B9G55_10410 [Saccharibacillus sp. O16]|nr:hypothetical protein B9G55_10410 [Saccharibacillus sp. O16]